MSESFGRYLKRERKLREIPLEEIARETKIKVGLLRALEDDRIGDLPSPAIVKGFLRSYARMLGLSANDLQLRYQSFLEQVAPDRLRPQSLRPWVPRKQRRLGAVGWLLLIALGIGVGLHLTGSEPARQPREESKSTADNRIVYRKNYLTGIETKSPPGTPPRIVAASPEWSGPAPGGVYVLLRALAPTTADLSLDGGAVQSIALLPGQPVVRHAFRGIVMETPEPGLVVLEVNGERLPPQALRAGLPHPVVRVSVPPRSGGESEALVPAGMLIEADGSGEFPIPVFPPMAGMGLAPRSGTPPGLREAPPPGQPRHGAPFIRPGPPGPGLRSSAGSDPARPAPPPEDPLVPGTPSNSRPTGR